MGIDIGTQSTRVALLDLDGQIVASSSTLQEMDTPKPGWGEQDPDHWWQNVVENIEKVSEQAGASADEILAIGVSGQMHATIPLGKDGNLLSHQVQLWCDKRCADLTEEFKTSPFLDSAMKIVGNPPVPAWLGFKIRWLKLNAPEVYADTWKFVCSPGYINYRLTGEVAAEWTDASGSFLMDTKTRNWSPEMISYLGLDPDKLPEIRDSAEIVGKVTIEASRQTGLAQGTPVVAGAGDMLCMLISSGLARPGRAADIRHSLHHGGVCG